MYQLTHRNIKLFTNTRTQWNKYHKPLIHAGCWRKKHQKFHQVETRTCIQTKLCNVFLRPLQMLSSKRALSSWSDRMELFCRIYMDFSNQFGVITMHTSEANNWWQSDRIAYYWPSELPVIRSTTGSSDSAIKEPIWNKLILQKQKRNLSSL